jgi:hypothetical protein
LEELGHTLVKLVIAYGMALTVFGIFIRSLVGAVSAE